MKFTTELPRDVLNTLKDEYPDKSYQAAIKAFVRQYKPINGINNDKNNHNTKCASTQAL